MKCEALEMAVLPRAPQRLGGAGSLLRVWGENRCGRASGGPWTSPKRFHTEPGNCIEGLTCHDFDVVVLDQFLREDLMGGYQFVFCQASGISETVYTKESRRKIDARSEPSMTKKRFYDDSRYSMIPATCSATIAFFPSGLSRNLNDSRESIKPFSVITAGQYVCLRM